MHVLLEDVFVTEGVPQFTFVPPPNFAEILLDLRRPGKPVIIEGQSGTGKTTCVTKAFEQLGTGLRIEKLTSRIASHISRIQAIADGKTPGTYLIDDFHRLDRFLQQQLGDLAKLAAENIDPAIHLPKLIIVGINEVGSALIHLVPDIAKRVGIHKIQSGRKADIEHLVAEGCRRLNVVMPEWEIIFNESKGDYWLTQQLCYTLCAVSGVLQTSPTAFDMVIDLPDLRARVTDKLRAAYHDGVKQFSRGQRFRPSNDPYFKLLRAIGQQDSSLVDLTELANANVEVRGSINNIKERRLGLLLMEKPECQKLFYYNSETKSFAIEDPAVFYYLRHLNWDLLRKECGFASSQRAYEYDFALSFAGENRELARVIAENIQVLDASVFFDEFFENNFLGRTWSKEFTRIFSQDARLVVCLLDAHYAEKIWPTFEKDCFLPRVSEAEVIPIFLDKTKFVGLSPDLNGIHFNWDTATADWASSVVDDIVFPLLERLS